MDISMIHLGQIDNNLTTLQEIEVVKKEWGEEHIICRNPHAAKIMKLNPTYQVSIHWHAKKTETFILVKGELIVEIINQLGIKEIVLLNTPLSSITINPNTPHTFYTPDFQEEETIFIEASTEDNPNDSFRFCQSGRRIQE